MLPTLEKLKSSLQQDDEEEKLLTTSLKQKVLKYLDSKFGIDEVNLFYQKCSFVDPRFKSKYSPRAAALLQTEADSGHVCIKGKIFCRVD